MGIKDDFLAVATLIKALPDRDLRITTWSNIKSFANQQRRLEREEKDRVDRTDQDIADSIANADIDV